MWASISEGVALKPRALRICLLLLTLVIVGRGPSAQAAIVVGVTLSEPVGFIGSDLQLLIDVQLVGTVDLPPANDDNWCLSMKPLVAARS